MENFINRYNNTENSEKLKFLTELLLKNSDLQKQFLLFVADEEVSSLNAITSVDIDEIRDALWSSISAIDVEEECSSGGEYEHFAYLDDEEGMGEFILEGIFKPYVDKVLSFIEKGNYLDAFRSILAIYELLILEVPDVYDDYYVFGDGLELHIEDFIHSSIEYFNSDMKYKVFSESTVNSFVDIWFERYSKYLESAKREEDNYFKISSFNTFFKQVIDEPQKANYLLLKLKEFELDNNLNSSVLMLHCTGILGDDEVNLKIANSFFLDSKEVALGLQKKYKELNNNSELERVSKLLLKEEQNSEYALFVIENIDKEESKSLYIEALEIYIKNNNSFEHYKLLREYLNEDERLSFIDKFKDGYNALFYVKLLEEEKQYPSILSFVKRNRGDYYLAEMVKPIISIYPQEVFWILTGRSSKLVKERGRKSYAKASELLKLASTIPTKKEELNEFVKELYNHKPRLPALQDELNKAGLV